MLFDWGDTLFSSPDAARVIVDAARELGATVRYHDARVLWDEIWAAGKTPEEQYPIIRKMVATLGPVFDPKFEVGA